MYVQTLVLCLVLMLAVYDANFRVSDSALVATGMTVRQYSGGAVVASRTIVVAGDVNSDGLANTVDARIILKSTVGAVLDTPLTEAQQLAADFDLNGEYATTDVRELLRSIVL